MNISIAMNDFITTKGVEKILKDKAKDLIETNTVDSKQACMESLGVIIDPMLDGGAISVATVENIKQYIDEDLTIESAKIKIEKEEDKSNDDILAFIFKGDIPKNISEEEKDLLDRYKKAKEESDKLTKEINDNFKNHSIGCMSAFKEKYNKVLN